MDIVALVLSCFRHSRKVVRLKVLAILEYMFHVSYRKVYKISRYGVGAYRIVQDLARKASIVKVCRRVEI